VLTAMRVRRLVLGGIVHGNFSRCEKDEKIFIAPKRSRDM